MTQQTQTFTTQISKTTQLNYLLHLPPGVEEGEKRPFILFLHGAGERGDDLDLIRLHYLPQPQPRLLDYYLR